MVFDPDKKLTKEEAVQWANLFDQMFAAGIPFTVATVRENECGIPRVMTGIRYQQAETDPQPDGTCRVDLIHNDERFVGAA